MKKFIIALFLGFMSITAGAQFKYEDFELKFQLGKYEFSSSIMMPISKWKKNMTIEDIKEYYLLYNHAISAIVYLNMFRDSEKEALVEFFAENQEEIEEKYDVVLVYYIHHEHKGYRWTEEVRTWDKKKRNIGNVIVYDRETYLNSKEAEKKRRAKAEKEKEDRMESLSGLL